MFFVIALTVFLLMHGYVGWRIIPSLNLSPLSNTVAYVLTFFMGFLPLLPIILRINGYESKVIDKISLIGYTSLGFFTLSFSFWEVFMDKHSKSPESSMAEGAIGIAIQAVYLIC